MLRLKTVKLSVTQLTRPHQCGVVFIFVVRSCLSFFQWVLGSFPVTFRFYPGFCQPFRVPTPSLFQIK